MATFSCPKCTCPQFPTEGKLSVHIREYHSEKCKVRFPGSSGFTKVYRINDTFICPQCFAEITTTSGMTKHARSSCPGGAEPLDQGGEIEKPVIISKDQGLPSQTVVETGHQPSFNDTALSACGELNASENDKKRALSLVDYLGLVPFTLKDPLGNDQAAFTNEPALKKLCLKGASEFATSINPVFKPKESLMSQLDQNVSDVSLRTLLATSPHSAVLQSRTFSELSEQLCEFMNKDWTFRPELQYACSQLLAGCILINTCNGQAVIANSIEVYGRTKQTDVHREHFSIKKNKAIQTSLPPKINIPYDGVWPMTLGSWDGEKLVIGTRIFNALVTSSMRLDLMEQASVGGITVTFPLRNFQSSKSTRIYLDNKSIEKAAEIASREKAWAISKEGTIWEMRQLRSKFDDPSTYLLCRSSGHLTNDHTSQPYTVFTLSCHDSLENGTGAAAAIIFHKIAKEVLKHGSKATIRRKVFKRALDHCSGNSDIVDALKKILSLFDDIKKSNPKRIPILRNAALNKELEIIAEKLSSHIAVANKTVVSFIEQNFTVPH
ncbi:hypothetical protein BGZ76_005597 [Entomortierella beljakovae]|nr:hypothetical protein BGZ76_005597 [Entomortierella beljakovae]